VVVSTAQEAVYSMRREMSRYTWKSAISVVMTIFFVLAVCIASFTWFIDRGYDRIAAMQSMEAQWQRKAPLADISMCDGKPCVKVDTTKVYGDQKETYLIIK